MRVYEMREEARSGRVCVPSKATDRVCVDEVEVSSYEPLGGSEGGAEANAQPHDPRPTAVVGRRFAVGLPALKPVSDHLCVSS